MENLTQAQRLLKSTLGVKLNWRRRDNWKEWMLIYSGPKDNLEEAIRVGNDVLTNPDYYEYYPAKEYGEFASVSKW